MAEPELLIEVEETPNPRARKFVVNRALTDGERRGFYTAEQAADDPLARELFAAGGVAGVMLLGNFCTVIATPAARWARLTPKVKKVLEAALQG